MPRFRDRSFGSSPVSDETPALDLAPLLDVIFLLLTFFALTLVLMVRAEILDVRLPDLGAGQGATQGTSVTVSLDEDGLLAINGEPTELDRLAADLVEATQEMDEPTIMLAVDTDSASGDLLRLVREVRAAGFERVGVLGQSGPRPEAEVGPGVVPEVGPDVQPVSPAR